MEPENPFAPPKAQVGDPTGDQRLSTLSSAVIAGALVHSLWFAVGFIDLLQIVRVGEVNAIYLLAIVIAATLLVAGAALLFWRSSKSRVTFALAAAFSIVALLQWKPLIAMFCFVVAVLGVVASFMQFKAKTTAVP